MDEITGSFGILPVNIFNLDTKDAIIYKISTPHNTLSDLKKKH